MEYTLFLAVKVILADPEQVKIMVNTLTSRRNFWNTEVLILKEENH
jgi:hypothetical protein